MTGLQIGICQVDTPEGTKDYVTYLGDDQIFQNGLSTEGIIGVLLRPLEPDQAITPDNFASNGRFLTFLHSVIARRAPQIPDFIVETERQGVGLVCVVDQRTPTPQGPVPPEDIIGIFQIENGQVVQDSYQAFPKHKLLSERGFFRLESQLQACLLEELSALANQAKA